MIIRQYTHGDKTEEGIIFCTIGKFALSAQVRRELGIAITSNPGDVWFIALDRGAVGFAAVAPQKSGKMLFKHAYVVPTRRNEGIYTSLLEKRLEHVGDAVCRVTANAETAPIYKKYGFVEISKRGKYTVMERRSP